MKYHDEKKVEKNLEWDKIVDMRSIHLGRVDFGTCGESRKDIELDPNDRNLSEVCFENLFPCVKGHAKIIDEYHSSRRLLFLVQLKKRK